MFLKANNMHHKTDMTADASHTHMQTELNRKTIRLMFDSFNANLSKWVKFCCCCRCGWRCCCCCYYYSLSSTSSHSEILQSTTTLSAGGKDQLSIQGFQHRCTDCLELSVFIYEKFHYHHHQKGTSENRTVRCCIWTSLTFLLPPAPPIRTLDIRCSL